jgi:hypothetical protein
MNHLARIGCVALAMAAFFSEPAAAQQLQLACDENGDGLIDASESRLCTERAFEELAAGEEALTEEQLGATGQAEQGLAFSEIDENGDGEISREEWSRWHEQRFTAATQESESGMPVADYESREWLQEGYARPMPEEAGQEQQ